MERSIFAIIDVGTSSTKLLVVEVENGSTTRELCKERIEEILEGGDMEELTSGKIPERMIRKKIDSIQKFQKKAEDFKSNKTKIVSTESFRKSSNADEVLQEIFEKTGLKVDVISQQKEAELFWKGIVADFPAGMEIAAIDIGGGSVEFMHGTKEKMEGHKLMNTGVFRLMKELDLQDPFTSDDVVKLEERVAEAIAVDKIDKKFPPGTPFIHGSSEVLNYYKQLGMPMKKYHHSKTHCHRVDLKDTRQYYEKFKKMGLEERVALTPKLPGFAHGVTPGLTSVLLIAEKTGLTFELPSNNNITNGIVLEMLENNE